jgi:hypothetical protein|nr:MAG TPA: hypothetical protein [Caudoviricetes sp.]
MTKINQHNNTRTVVMLSSSTLSAKDKGEEGDWKGRRFRKQIAAFGQLYSPFDGEECELLDEAWAEEMLANFEAKQSGKIPTLPRVSIPFDHWSGTKDNAGEVVALEIVPGDGVYATLEIRDYEALYRLEQDLVFDVSMCFNWHYIDTRTGDDRGIVLEHVALVNDPFITGMNAFEEAPEQLKRDEVEKAEAYLDNFNRRTNAVVMFSKNKVEELAKMRKHFSKDTEGEQPEVVEVTNDRDFDVVITVKNDDGEDVSKTVKAGETVEVPADQEEAVKKQIADAKDPNEEEGEGDDKENMSREGEADEDKDGEDKADEGDGEAGENETDKKGEGDDKENLSRSEREELSRLRAERNQAKAETAYQTMLSAGMIVPAQKDAFMQLHQNLSKAGGRVEFNRDGKKVELSTTELLEELVKAGGKRVQFNQTGSTNGEAADKDDDAAISKNLSQEEVEGLKANGITTKQIDELAAKSPAYAEAMARVKSNE